MTILESLNLGLAALGSTLGIYNAWRGVYRDRIRLRVVPSVFFREGKRGVAVTVINDGFYPVQVTMIAFRISKPGEFLVIRPSFVGEAELPHYLEARASLTGYFSPTTKEYPLFAPVTGAFVRTAVGLEFDGTGEALLRYAAELGATGESSTQRT